MSLFKKKAVVEAPRKAVSIEEMKVRFRACDKKFTEYIKKYQSLAEKHVENATRLKMKGLDARDEIKRIALFQARIRAADKRRFILSTMLENYQTMEFEKEFLKTLSEMSSLFGNTDLDVGDLEATAKEVMDANTRIAVAQEKITARMEDLDSALTAADALSGDVSLHSVEAQIDAIINRTISDAAFAAVEQTPEAIARAVSEKIRLQE